MPVRLVPATSGKSIKLDKPVLLVGRSPSCDVILTTSRKVSRTHCLVACIENQVIVRDLGSTNGVWVNGQRIDREGRVRAGDQLSFADVDYHLLNVDAQGNVVDSSVGPKGHGRRDGDRVAPRNAQRPNAAQPSTAQRAIEPGQAWPVAIPDESADFAVEESMPRLPRIKLSSIPERGRGRVDEPSESEAILPEPENMQLDSRYTNRRERHSAIAADSDHELDFDDAASDGGDPLQLDGAALEIDEHDLASHESNDLLPDLNFGDGAESDDGPLPLGPVHD